MTTLNRDFAQVADSFIKKRFGEVVTPEEILEEAKKKNCPIHDYFEWDDKVAGHQWRLQQARLLIAFITVEYEDIGEVRAYHNVTIDNERKYVSSNLARNTPDLWNQVLESALREANNWKKRFSQYSQLSLIVNAIEETTKKLAK